MHKTLATHHLIAQRLKTLKTHRDRNLNTFFRKVWDNANKIKGFSSDHAYSIYSTGLAEPKSPAPRNDTCLQFLSDLTSIVMNSPIRISIWSQRLKKFDWIIFRTYQWLANNAGIKNAFLRDFIHFTRPDIRRASGFDRYYIKLKPTSLTAVAKDLLKLLSSDSTKHATLKEKLRSFKIVTPGSTHRYEHLVLYLNPLSEPERIKVLNSIKTLRSHVAPPSEQPFTLPADPNYAISFAEDRKPNGTHSFGSLRTYLAYKAAVKVLRSSRPRFHSFRRQFYDYMSRLNKSQKLHREKDTRSEYGSSLGGFAELTQGDSQVQEEEIKTPKPLSLEEEYRESQGDHEDDVDLEAPAPPQTESRASLLGARSSTTRRKNTSIKKRRTKR